VKEAAGQESVRITEEYRRTRLAWTEQLLSLGTAAEHEIDDLKKTFAHAHENTPDLSAFVYINEVPTPKGPGSLQFRELANRAAWTVARVGGDDAWKRWLDVVVGYLLENDLHEEFIQKFPIWHLDRPEGTTPEAHLGTTVQGENYEIRQVFKASEHCCSWLKRRGREKKPSSASAASGDPRQESSSTEPYLEQAHDAPADTAGQQMAVLRTRKGDVTLLGNSHAVTFKTAERYLGITVRHRQNLMKSGVLQIEGKGQNRRITVASLKTYLPPENTQ